MSGKSTSTTNQSQQQSTAPWKPTQGPLVNMIEQITGQMGSMQPTANESNAFSSMLNNYLGMKPVGEAATSLSQDLLTGGPDRSGYVTDAFSKSAGVLDPYLQANYTDPTKTPGLMNALSTIKHDVGNNINSMFAGAGRDLSGKHVESLARGLSQGMALPMLNQYNQNVQTQLGAGQTLYNMGRETAGALSNLDQTAFGNRAQGIDVGMNAPRAANAPYQGVLDIEAARRGLPLNNMSNILSLLLPIAGTGSEMHGTGTSTTTNNMSPLQKAMAITGILKNITGMLPSDPGLKENIEAVGELFDGTPVYRYNYIGQDRTYIGLLSTDVKRYAPEAVARYLDFEAVDYKRATDRAVQRREVR